MDKKHITKLKGKYRILLDELVNKMVKIYRGRAGEIKIPEGVETYQEVVDYLNSLNLYRGKFDFKKKIIRATGRSKEVANFIQGFCDFGPLFMDIGSGDGTITVSLMKYYKLSPSNVYATETGENKQELLNNRLLKNENKIIGSNNYPNILFDTITCLQVLHHFKDIDGMIINLNRHLKIGGHLIIREHNADKKKRKILINLEHYIYDNVIKGVEPTYSYIKTRSLAKWHKILEKYGFEYVNHKIIDGSVTNNCYLLYKKIENYDI